MTSQKKNKQQAYNKILNFANRLWQMHVLKDLYSKFFVFTNYLP